MRTHYYPTIFSGPMVLSILSGIKSQTRRIIKPEWLRCLDLEDTDDQIKALSMCPYGKPGDQLWVRETWKIGSFMEGEPVTFQYRADGKEAEENRFARAPENTIKYEDWYERICYQSSDQLLSMGWSKMDRDGCYEWEWGKSPLPWRSPIFMPRWASRITQEIISIKIQRLNEMTDTDAREEGAPASISLGWDGNRVRSYLESFIDIWDKLNADRGYGWIDNPYVWVINFKMVPQEKL